MLVTGSELAKLLTTLTKAQAAALIRTVLGVKTPDRFNALNTADVLAAGVWEFLQATDFVTEIQATLVVHHMRPALGVLAGVLDVSSTTLPTFRLTIAERRWITWPTWVAWFDIYTQETVIELPEPPVLLVVGDVTALYVRLGRWLDRFRGTPGGAQNANPTEHVDRSDGNDKPGGRGPGTPGGP
jgi:hypothetical protein